MVTAGDRAFLDEMKDEIGPVFGSETLCLLLHVLALREKPLNIIELGTGLGVTTVWIAAALEMNGEGRLITIDDGSLFPLKNQAFAEKLDRMFPGVTDHAGFMDQMKARLSFGDRIEYHNRKLDFDSPDGLLQALEITGTFDWAFCDVTHSPRAIESCLAAFLSMSEPAFSLFIDSASTYTESFLMAERLVGQLNRSKVPEVFNEISDLSARERLIERTRDREFSIHHFIEQVYRNQNSTMLIRACPVDQIPYPATFMR